MGASAGRVLLIPKGDWNAETTYTGLDWVRHKGAAWVCKNTCTGIEPTEANSAKWQMMARDGDGITADTAMSDTSTNAVQNKVVKSYVDNSITGISDMTGATATQNGAHGLVPAPQAGDEKKVLLGDGTWGAIDDKFSFSDHDTATSGTSFTDAEDGNMIVTDWTKNLLNPTLQTTTQNGVTCTNNGDGTYTLNGTATGQPIFWLNENVNVTGSNLKLVCCPPNMIPNEDAYSQIMYDDNKWGEHEAGDGVVINSEKNILKVIFTLHNGYTANNLVIKPMLTTDLSATYDDFVPYGGYEIKSCGKNLLNLTLETATQNGVTCTNNGDGTYTLNGTNNSNSDTEFQFVMGKLKIGETYRITGCPSNNPANCRFILAHAEGTWYYVAIDLGDGITYTCNDDLKKRIIFNIPAGCTCDNMVFKPMITTDLNATYDDFEPYTGETITVTNDTESPAFGLKSHKGITNIISPGNVKCVYPTNESGKGVLDAMYNNELSKLKNAIFKYSTKEEYDAAVANNEIPDGATVIKDYDD